MRRQRWQVVVPLMICLRLFGCAVDPEFGTNAMVDDGVLVVFIITIAIAVRVFIRSVGFVGWRLRRRTLSRLWRSEQ